MQIFPTRMYNVTAWRHSSLRAHCLMTLEAGDWGGILREFPLSFAYGSTGRVCARAELNGGENSLHWKANMLPLFSIMTLCFRAG